MLGPDIPHGLDSVDEGVEFTCFYYYLVNAVGERIGLNGFDRHKYQDTINAVESALTIAINQANFERIEKRWADTTCRSEPQPPVPHREANDNPAEYLPF